MNTVYVLYRLSEDDSIAEIISAHPTSQIAMNAERFYRQFGEGRNIDLLRTDIQPVEFEV